MATIYRFIIENRNGADGGADGRKNNTAPSRKATAKGRWVSVLGGSKGGVEHNRKMRAINPLLNRATGGVYEKAMRVGRAGSGLIQVDTETGAWRLSPVSKAIILSFIIQTMFKIQKKQRDIANEENSQNYKAMENGMSAVHGEFNVTRNYWDGKINYNENK